MSFEMKPISLRRYVIKYNSKRLLHRVHALLLLLDIITYLR